MSAITGAQVFSESGNPSIIRYDAIGKNSEVIAAGDIVQLTSGLVNVGTVSMVGVAVKTATMASTNQTVAKVQPGYVPITDTTLFLMGTNSDLTGNATDAGTYYTITGGTGAQVVHVSGGAQTGAVRSVEIVKVDPFNEGGTGAGSGLRKCVVRLLKTPYSNVQITS